MSNLNDTSVHPTGVQGAYAGVQNPSSSSVPKESDKYADEGTLSGHAPSSEDPKRDVVEGAPGVIEGTELAPLGEDKIAPDPSLIDQATALARQAVEAVTGSK